MPELPEARAHRFQEQYGLTAYDAAVLTDTRDEADTYEALVAAGVLLGRRGQLAERRRRRARQ